MHTPAEDLVKRVLLHHLDLAPGALRLGHDLRRDLGLDDLDLVCVALDLEDIERRTGAATEFPVARLEDVRTVADLIALSRDWARERDDEEPPTLRVA